CLDWISVSFLRKGRCSLRCACGIAAASKGGGAGGGGRSVGVMNFTAKSFSPCAYGAADEPNRKMRASAPMCKAIEATAPVPIRRWAIRFSSRIASNIGSASRQATVGAHSWDGQHRCCVKIDPLAPRHQIDRTVTLAAREAGELEELTDAAAYGVGYLSGRSARADLW